MNIFELFITAVALSMDAFAVAVCMGLSMKTSSFGKSVKVGSYFGGFQALMPVIGYYLGVIFKNYIVAFDHWIAFILLGMIGINMVKESRECEICSDYSFDIGSMLVLSVATSIDALAVGVTFATLGVDIIPAVALIGAVTFTFSALGMKIGNIFGVKYKSKAELAGGIILITMGIKILMEHLFF